MNESLVRAAAQSAGGTRRTSKDTGRTLASAKAVLRNSWLSPRYLATAYIGRVVAETRENVKGTLLDVGCGLRQYEPILADRVQRYVGMDWPVRPEASRPDIVADALHIPFRDRSVDTVFATELIEHLPDPDKFMSEVARVLRSDGSLIFSVPFLEPLHEEPRDYYRFTPHGLRVLLERHGFSIMRMWSRGGWWSVVLGSFVSKPLYDLANPENRRNQGRDRWWWALLVLPICTIAQMTAYFLDGFSSSRTYTMGYVVLAARAMTPHAVSTHVQ